MYVHAASFGRDRVVNILKRCIKRPQIRFPGDTIPRGSINILVEFLVDKIGDNFGGPISAIDHARKFLRGAYRIYIESIISYSRWRDIGAVEMRVVVVM